MDLPAFPYVNCPEDVSSSSYLQTQVPCCFAGQYFLFLCPGFVGMAALCDVGGGDTTEVHPKCLTWLWCGWVGWEGQNEGNCTNELSD